MTETIKTSIDGKEYDLLEASENVTLTGMETLIFVSAGDITLASLENSSELITIRNISTGNIKILPQSGNDIQGRDMLNLENGRTVRLVNNRNQWIVKGIIDNKDWLIDRVVIEKLKNYIPETFPYERMLKDGGGVDCFRYMVDDLLGNDNFNGLSWNTPKKTIQGVIDALPQDGRNIRTYILIHPALYEENIVINKFNHIITMCYVGLFANANYTGDLGNPNLAVRSFYRGDVDNPIRNGNAVEIQGLSDDVSKSVIFVGRSDRNTELDFRSCDMAYGWNTVQYSYFRKFIVRNKPSLGSTAPVINYEGGRRFDCEPQLTIDLQANNRNGLALGTGGYITGIDIIGGTGLASTGSGGWNGGISLQNIDKAVIFKHVSFQEHADASRPNSPNGANYVVSGVRCFITAPWYCTRYELISIQLANGIQYSQGSLPDADLPYIDLSSGGNFSGVIHYKNDSLQLRDASIQKRQIKEINTGVVKTYYDSDLYNDGTHLYYKAVQLDT